MAWLNFNDSLNNLRGQISNFASNVLADEDAGAEINDSDYKALQELCHQQELEITKLRQINEGLTSNKIQKHDASESNESWNWSTNEEPPPTSSTESISDLKKQISLLESEKSELLGQLDQLDADNQENLANIMKMKEKLQYELNDVNENYLRIKKENKTLIEKEQTLKKQLKEKETFTAIGNNDEYIKKCKDLTEANQKVNSELEELKKELSVVKSSNETLQKILEDTKKPEEDSDGDKLKKLESENKLLYSELKKANETVTIFEKKSLEDEENCQKLAFILESYEQQVSKLKQELEHVSKSYEDSQNKLNESEKACNNLKEEKEIIKEDHNTTLQTLSEELETFKQQTENAANLNQIQQLELNIENYKQEIDKLKKEVEDLNDPTKQPDFALTKELEEKIEIYKKELETFKTDNENLQKLNEDLLIKATGRMDRDLESELEDIQSEHEAQLNVLREELELLKNQESQNRTDGKKFDDLEEEKLTLTREVKDLYEQLEELKNNHQISLQGLHNKYINIITENIKKFQNCEKPSDFHHQKNNEDPQVEELTKHIEELMTILLQSKCKCEDLEKRLLDLAEEKNVILIEKNLEIEKLIQNSDMLSQEILSKTQTVKDFENECNELAKNNELLISELETLKSNPGLQTISESNEDNMILLESQLENANKRIDDLERIIDDLEKNQIRKDSLEDNSDLENAVKQLNITEEEICNKKKDYQVLLISFDQLQVEYESLKSELEENKENIKFYVEENSELKATVEKLKADYENAEYQLSEININCETMKEELEEQKIKFKHLLNENSNLKLQTDEKSHSVLDFETKINVLEEKLATEENAKRNLASQIEALTEKLKNSKMAETSLKLQYEQKSKELAAQSEERYNLEIALNKINADLAEFQNNFIELQNQNDTLLLEQEQLKENTLKKDEKVKQLENLVKELETKLENHSIEASDTNKHEDDVNKIEKSNNEDNNNLKLILDQTVLEKANLQAELSKLSQVQSQLKESTEKCTTLHQQLQEITNSRNELINMVTMKHQENVTYHNEIQRLNQVVTSEVEKYKYLEAQIKQLQSTSSKEDIELKNQEIEKLTDQNNFLKEKCEIIAKNLLDEQAKTQQLITERSIPSEKETTLQKNLDRLQAHLIELEEHYTEELLQAEQKNNALKTKMVDIEEREKNSSTMYTSVSIRANQQVESLQSQLQNVMVERDVLRKQISDAEDENTKQAAALANLQFVLDQFRKDKEIDVQKETERIRRQINAEKQVQDDLRQEISNLHVQLEERNQGLLAASRLSDQLEASKKTILGLKDEVSQLQSKLSKTEKDLSDALSSTDGKVDKLLIKNLILGFVTANNNMNRDQSQILKIIATVLDFNQQDHDKVKLNKPQQGWLASFLAPNPDNQNKMTEESLSRAFIQFLENESRPRVVPSLLDNAVPTPSNASTKSTSSKSTTPRQSPIVLSEIVLPTFSDFAQNRNSSSILKDVLKDNSQL